MSALPDWITDPALAPTWDRVRVRFEKAGLQSRGLVRLPLATREERQAVGALLGRTLTRPSVTVDLDELDARLRCRSGVGGLPAVLSGLGLVPQDRPGRRDAALQARERPLELAAELVQTPWTQEWVGGLRRSGLLTNRDDALAAVRDAAAVLVSLTQPPASRPAQSRVELAAHLLADSHALDRDRLAHQLVVRGLAAATGQPVPASGRDREALWARFGVEPDLLSRTCLVWGLRAEKGSAAARLDAAAEANDPLHVTEWDLRRLGGLRPSAGNPVLVCENPRVLEAMAEHSVAAWSGVCTSGEPNLVVDRVLSDLASSGADLHYHGDFDWPGIAIANRVVSRYGAMPWRMSVTDYLDAVRPDRPPLRGLVVEPSWDGELGAAMRMHQRAVHEESVLGGLVEALRR